MTQLLYGFAFFFCGLGLIIYSKQLAELNRAVNKTLGANVPGVKWFRIGNIIVGALIGTLGLLFMLDIAQIK